MFPTASVSPVGVDGGAQEGGLVRADDADRGRAAQQRAEQVAARSRRVVERHALAGQQQRAIELVVEQRAGAESLGLGRGRLVARVPALLERDGARDHREHQQRADAGEDRSQPPLRALARGPALSEERPLGRVEVGVVVGGPLERRRQARAAVELAGVAAACLPLACGGLRRCWCTRRPSASSSSHPRRRGHSRSSASCATSTLPSPIVTSRSSASAASTSATRRRPPSSSSATRRRTTRVAFALAREPQQDPPRGLAAARGSSRSYVLSASRATAPCTPPDLLVGGHAQRPPVAMLPQLEQRRWTAAAARQAAPSTSATSASVSSGST